MKPAFKRWTRGSIRSSARVVGYRFFDVFCPGLGSGIDIGHFGQSGGHPERISLRLEEIMRLHQVLCGLDLTIDARIQVSGKELRLGQAVWLMVLLRKSYGRVVRWDGFAGP